MSRLLKYAIVLALAIAIGAYIVLGPLSFEDLLPGHPEQEARAGLEPTPPAPSASFDEELDYMVAKRLGSLEGWRAFLAAHPNGAYAQSARVEVRRRFSVDNASAEAPVAAPAAAPKDSERRYGVVQRFGSLAAYAQSAAQSATAKVQQLLLAEKAPAPSNSGGANGASSDARIASESTAPASSPSGGAVPATDAAAVLNGASPDAKAVNAAAGPVSSPSGDAAPTTAAPAVANDASQDAKSVNEVAGPAAQVVRTDGAAEMELAALTPDEICQRDGDRLARLRTNPSSDEVARFANELGCEKLRPQIVSLMESLAPTPASAASNVAPLDAQAAREEARPVPPVVGADVASLASDETCKRDEDRLARLRSNPSGEEAERFAGELGCQALRPQLRRLMESLGLVKPASLATPNSSVSSNSLLPQRCASERAALDRVRAEPSAEAARLFWRDLQCERLRPQVRLLLESLNLTPESLGSSAAPGEAKWRDGAAFDAPTPNAADPDACRRETAQLNRIRATPDLGDAKRFASIVTCDALKPQAARLLESLAE